MTHSDDVDGTLEDWSPCITKFDDLNFVVGTITGDRKARFPDGTLMTTSLLATPLDQLTDGAIITTMSSRYRLGRRARGISFEAFAYAASLNGQVLDPDGQPVTSMKLPTTRDTHH